MTSLAIARSLCGDLPRLQRRVLDLGDTKITLSSNVDDDVVQASTALGTSGRIKSIQNALEATPGAVDQIQCS